MPSCLPVCGKSKKKDEHSSLRNSAAEDTVACGNCATVLTLPAGSTAIVCSSCRSVNRIEKDNMGSKRISVVTPGTDDIVLVRTSSTVFLPENVAPDPSLAPHEAVDDTIPLCSVCLDGAGDIVLLPCAHGGFCETCARHIAQNMAVGGAHCPKCRESITRLVRISNIHHCVAHAAEIKVDQAAVQKAPPKVPPPPGHKKKSQTRGPPQRGG